jgi:hypothetical protein
MKNKNQAVEDNQNHLKRNHLLTNRLTRNYLLKKLMMNLFDQLNQAKNLLQKQVRLRKIEKRVVIDQQEKSHQAKNNHHNQ